MTGKADLHDVPIANRALLAFIEEIERGYFRSNADGGANHQALFIWNRVRVAAGLPEITEDDLPGSADHADRPYPRMPMTQEERMLRRIHHVMTDRGNNHEEMVLAIGTLLNANGYEVDPRHRLDGH